MKKKDIPEDITIIMKIEDLQEMIQDQIEMILDHQDHIEMKRDHQDQTEMIPDH